MSSSPSSAAGRGSAPAASSGTPSRIPNVLSIAGVEKAIALGGRSTPHRFALKGDVVLELQVARDAPKPALAAAAKANGAGSDPLIRQRLMAYYTKIQILRINGLRSLATTLAAEAPATETVAPNAGAAAPAVITVATTATTTRTMAAMPPHFFFGGGGGFGLGNRLTSYSSMIQMPQFFAVVMILSTLGILIYVLFFLLGKKFASWEA
mgnify:CR=1 FL=1